MKSNTRLNDNAAVLRQMMSDARNSLVLSDDGTAELANTVLTLSVLSTVVHPLQETCKLVNLLTEEIASELYHCIALCECLPIQWCPGTSFGLDLSQAVNNLAMAELIAGQSYLDLVFDEFTLEVTVRPLDCECDEPCDVLFDVLDDSRELLAFVREWDQLALQCVGQAGEQAPTRRKAAPARIGS